MKPQETLSRSVIYVALLTIAILLIPFVAMQFNTGVNWGVGDFVIMAALIFSIGMGYKLIARKSPNWLYRIATILAIGTTFLMIWANLAVGLIGSGSNPGNLMYIGVVAVAIAGIILSGLKPTGMERAMYATVLALALLSVIAYLNNMHQYPGSSLKDVFGVSGFFAVIYVVAGILFRYAVYKELSNKSYHKN